MMITRSPEVEVEVEDTRGNAERRSGGAEERAGLRIITTYVLVLSAAGPREPTIPHRSSIRRDSEQTLSPTGSATLSFHLERGHILVFFILAPRLG